MKVSTNSWHYRLMDFVDINQPDNLCAYFWCTVFSMILVCAMGGVLAIGVPVVIGLATYPLWWWLTDDSLVFVVIVGVVEVSFLVWLLQDAVTDRHQAERYEGNRGPYKQSLFGAWAHAQHRKVCPLIDFE